MFAKMSRNSLESHPRPQPPSQRRGRGSKLSWGRRLRYYYWRLVRMQGRPETIARGLACGVFAGLFPLFGLQTIIGVLLAFLFRGNKIVAAAGTWVSNPFTYVPIYAFNFKIGQVLLARHELADVSLSSWAQIRELGGDILFTLFVGCFAIGLVCGACSYFLGVWLIRRGRRRRSPCQLPRQERS